MTDTYLAIALGRSAVSWRLMSNFGNMPELKERRNATVAICLRTVTVEATGHRPNRARQGERAVEERDGKNRLLEEFRAKWLPTRALLLYVSVVGGFLFGSGVSPRCSKSFHSVLLLAIIPPLDVLALTALLSTSAGGLRLFGGAPRITIRCQRMRLQPQFPSFEHRINSHF
jgi:hypothetical protein